MSDTAVKIDAKLVKELREKSGAPMGDCLKALQESKGEMEEAFVVLGKFYEEFCLLDQPFIKDQTQTIAQIIATKVAKLGENISVRRFARFKVGDPNWTVATTKLATEEASV